MEQFKIEHFNRDFPNTPFPRFRPLSPEETWGLRAKLRNVLNVEPEASDRDLTQLIAAVAVLAPDVKAEDPDFRLSEQLRLWGIEPESEVYVNWHRYDEMDAMSLEDLSHCFQYVWYPSADDIEVLDKSCSWIVTVSHAGDVGLARL